MISNEFLISSLVVVLVPGTGVIYTLTNGIFKGKKASLAAAAGCTLGIVPHLVACIAGLSALLHMSALAFQILKYAGAIYLLYLAWNMWKDSGDFGLNDESTQSESYLQIIRKGFLINILNPKLSIFFLAFLPLFVNQEGSATIQMLVLSFIFMALTFVVFIGYGMCADAVSERFLKKPAFTKWLKRTFSATFALLGLKLATAHQE